MQSSITRPRSQQTTYLSSLALRPPARRGALPHLVYDVHLVSSTAFVRSCRRRGQRAHQHSDETYVRDVPFTKCKRARPYPHRPHPSSADTPSPLVHSRTSIHRRRRRRHRLNTATRLCAAMSVTTYKVSCEATLTVVRVFLTARRIARCPGRVPPRAGARVVGVSRARQAR